MAINSNKYRKGSLSFSSRYIHLSFLQCAVCFSKKIFHAAVLRHLLKGSSIVALAILT